MLLATAISKNGVPIRLTQERWIHITTSHVEISSTDFSPIMTAVEDPDIILKGDHTELLAVKKKSRKTSGLW